MSAETAAESIQSTDSLLRFAMRADAILSCIAGVGIVATAPTLSTFSGIPEPIDYAIGIGFIVLSLVVFALAARPRVRVAGIGIATANAIGALFTVVVVLAGVLPLTTAGVVLILANGVYMAIMAGLQYLGLRRMKR
jgi:hypothetical protein